MLAGWLGPLAFIFVSALAIVGIDAARAAEGATPAIQRQFQPAAPQDKPEFALPDMSGSQHSLQQQRGKLVLVHFFATWCEPCREELSSLSRLVGERHGDQLIVLAINVAEVPARVRRFIDASPVTFPILLDADRAVTKAWGVSILPTTFVLDRELSPRLFVEGDLDWDRSDVRSALDQISAERSK